MVKQREMHTEALMVELVGDVAKLTLNRPSKRNALDQDLVQALGDALSRYGRDASIRAIVLAGSGGAFCAGADLASIEAPLPEEISSRIDEFHRLILEIVQADKAVIALVDGPAVGFGADLALACDMRLFSEAGYIEEGFVKIGLMPDGGGTHWMRRFAGPRAFEFLALGTRLSAAHCKELGIANGIYPSETLAEEGEQLANRLSSAPPLALSRIKKSLRAAEEVELKAALAREKTGQSTLIQSKDYQEGLAAFRNKRLPKFQGC